MMSSALLMRQPSREESSHLGACETNALIHAVLQLSRERGLAMAAPPQYAPLPRPAGRFARGAFVAALLLAFGGFSFWMGARQNQGDAPAVAATATATPAAALAPEAEPERPINATPVQVDPAMLKAVMAALAQASAQNNAHAAVQAKPVSQPRPATPAPVVQPRPVAPAPVKAVPVAKAVPAVATPAPQPSPEPAKAADGTGVNVDLGNLGAAQPAPVIRRMPAPPTPALAPAQAQGAGDFSVVSVLDGMVLVQQGRRVSPVAVGQALPDGRVLQGADAASGKFQASKP